MYMSNMYIIYICIMCVYISLSLYIYIYIYHICIAASVRSWWISSGFPASGVKTDGLGQTTFYGTRTHSSSV